ncbi:MAG: OmpH family outer membrane protein [Candidatus Omnitrophota bacterium]|nr:OmpH family outer membrane protein [Candidatus Omnitrophota bacterium]
MSRTSKMLLAALAAGLVASCVLAAPGYSADVKIGYVDLRQAFYEYDKTKNMEQELAAFTEDTQEKRTKMIEGITKLRDEAELLSEEAKRKKQGEIDNKLSELQEFDRGTRQTLLNKRNDMFREVIDDIQVVVKTMGKEGGYDYVLDSRNIMYANETFDLTEEVLKRLNK